MPAESVPGFRYLSLGTLLRGTESQPDDTIGVVGSAVTPRRQRMIGALSFEYTKYPYVEGACDISPVSPGTYNLDYALFQRPGKFDIQTDFLISYCDYILNRLPEAQACLRNHQPDLLAIWGANDPYYPKEGAEAFKADVPGVEFSIVRLQYGLNLYASGLTACATIAPGGGATGRIMQAAVSCKIGRARNATGFDNLYKTLHFLDANQCSEYRTACSHSEY